MKLRTPPPHSECPERKSRDQGPRDAGPGQPIGARHKPVRHQASGSGAGSVRDARTKPAGTQQASLTTPIITGSFAQLPEAHGALSDLASAGFAPGRTATFFVSPPAEPDQYCAGDGPPPIDGAATGGASGAAIGAAIGAAAGLAALPLLGPAAVAVAGAGAYAGSFAGAMLKLEDQNEPVDTPNAASHRKAGTLIAVAAETPEQQRRAADLLRARGATDIERTEGRLVDGQWTDFDPQAPLQPLKE